eukprot:XP_015573982.1 myosin heavy chain, skeletal muscle, adult isoform X2 [Ricinus communis]
MPLIFFNKSKDLLVLFLYVGLLVRLLGRSTGFQVGSTHQLCTKGLWMWSAPLKKIALDGTEYNLLLFDSGGTNTCDQTEIYSTQIFSVAVLLSSLFVYNQVGVIDEAALDHLSLVTEMTKHVHRRASQGKNLVSELGHFSPVFMWLLRDFYLDLTEDNIEMKPHDYLELALSPVLGSGRDIAAKNKIRESIRAVFPSRECFTLVRPLNNETDLQHLDRVSLDKFRPEFLSGLHAFANFVYERTRPKQAGDNVMTGPLLAGITKSLVDALNNGAAPTISFSWQVCTRDSVIETDLECSNAIQGMEKRLQEACLATDAKIENLAVVLESLLSKYEESVHGPTKWQKLSSFLQKSLQGPFLHHAQKLIDEASLEKSSLIMKCRSNEDKIELLHKQLEASEKSKAEYQKCYADAIDDFKKLSNRYKSRKIDLESKSSLLEERCSSSLEMLDSAKQEALEWKRKYEEILTAKRAANDQANTNTAVCKSGICEAEATVAATAEQSRMALKEANEWKEKYDIAINEAKAARDKAAEQAKLIEEDVAAAAEQSQLALKEAIEWKEKYEIAVNEVKAAREKAAELAKLKEEDVAAAAEQSRLALEEANEWKEKYDIAINEAKAAREKAAELAKLKEEDIAAAAEQSRLALKEAKEWKEKYDIAINEAKAAREKAAEQAKLKEEDVAAVAEQSRLALKEANEWKEKYEIAINEAKAAREKAAELAKLKEENIAAAAEQSRLALKEANEWKEKYDIAINEAKAARDKAAEHARLIEDVAAAAEQSRLALKEANEWKEKYEIAINEAKAAREKAAEQAKLKEEDIAAAAEQSRLALKEANEWKEEYGIAINEAKAAKGKAAEQAKLIEEDAAAAAEQSRLALKEANEWKEKYGIAISEANAAREKATEQEKLIEENLRAQFNNSLAEKDEQIKDKITKLEEAEQRLAALTLDLKTAETKIESYVLELSALKHQMKELAEKYDFVKAAAQSMEREAQTLIDDRVELEQKCLSELKRFEEAHEGWKVAKEEVMVTNEFIEAEQSEVLASQDEKHDEKHESHQLTIDRLAQTSSHIHTQVLERAKMGLAGDIERSTALEDCAMSKIAILEAIVKERDEEIELLKKKCEQFVNTIPTLESNLESEHAAHAEVNKMEKAPFLPLESLQEGLNLAQQELTPNHSHGYAQGSGLKTYSGRKHPRLEVPDLSVYSLKMETPEEITREMKKPKSSSAMAKCTTAEIDSVFRASEEDSEYEKAASVDYTKLTVWKLRRELNEHGFGEELQKLRYPKKKDVIALYEKFVLKK